MSNNNPHQRQQGTDPSTATTQEQAHFEKIQRIRQYWHKQMMEKVNQLKTQYVTDYPLHLNYPARVTPVVENTTTNHVKNNNTQSDKALRTDAAFINARLLEAGLPLGGGIPLVTTTSPSKMTLRDHGSTISRFIRDLEGTGCYDSVQVFLGKGEQDTNDGDANEGEQTMNEQQPIDVTVRLKEKKWYKIYIGGGVNADDLSSLGNNSSGGGGLGDIFGGGGAAGALGALPKVQFETSASLLNLTGFADVSTALYSVDQTGTSAFKFTHDRPLCSWLPKQSQMYQSLMPPDPRHVDPAERDAHNNGNSNTSMDETEVFLDDDTQFALGFGSHTTLGIHAILHDVDYESIRSSKECTRSIGIRLANHCRSATRSPGTGGPNKSNISTPETMAGPYLFLDWSASLKDVMPRRHAEFPFALDCSNEVACSAGTALKNSLMGGMYLNGCYTDDRYDPTMGYDAHMVGEVAGPPGDVGFWKVKGGGSWHFPLELLQMMVFGIGDEKFKEEEENTPTVIGMTLHSSFNFGLVRPLTFNGLCNTNGVGGSGGIPSSDRFYIGGPGQLRGFMPAGIGPRSSKGGSSVPGGDSLGGDLFYTSTLATSVPFPTNLSTLRQNGARLFGFANAGTCVSASGLGAHSLVGLGAWNQILQSTRLAVGGGVSVGSPMGRFEATYAVPIRYGPRDARKSVQFGFGFSFG